MRLLTVFKFTFSLLVALVLLAPGSLSVPAQTRPDFNRPQTYDVQHYLIRASFDRAKRKVFGDTTVTIKPLKQPFSQAVFDAADMAFEKITIDPSDVPLKFRVQGEKVTVDLGKNFVPDETVSIRFKYVATPKKGVYFVDARIEDGKIISPAQIYSQGEADEAHHWIPSFDFPSDKATTEQFLTVPKGETVVANGEMKGTEDNGDGTVTFHYLMPVPHSLYLLSFVVGDYVKLEDRHNDIPLGFYVYKGKEYIVPKAFGKTKDMMRVYEEVTGVKYPYNKYDQTIVSGFSFGGMENITATTMADTDIFLADFELTKSGAEDLVSHELAHSWFGDLVTCRNWAELWLNEGFATFMEAVYREKTYGRRNYMVKVLSDASTYMADEAVNPKRNGLFNQNAGDVNALFDRPATTYNKGGAVLHTLRELLGDEAFWRGVNIYLNRHKFASVETSDLEKAMEESSGRDLGWFFEQWVYGTGYPKLDVKPVYNARSRSLVLTVTQTQKVDKLTPAAFRLPLTIELVAAGNKTEFPIEITRRVETVTLKTNSKPTAIKIDPQEKIPIKSVKLRPLL